MLRSPLAASFLLIVGSTAAAGRAEEPAGGPGAFSERIEVRVVEVEVSVRDRDGRTVIGLSKDDFQLLVDGQPVSIEYFEERRPDAGPSSGSDGSSPPGDAGAQDRPVNVLVYIDEEYSLPIDLERVLAGLASQLGVLRSQDRIAIAAWDGHRLEKLLDWSAPGAEVAATLADARQRPAWGLRTRLDEGGRSADQVPPGWNYRDAGADLVGFNCGGYRARGSEACAAALAAGGRGTDHPSLLEIDNRIDRTARAVAAAIRSFTPQDGRRIVALLSGGWDSGLRYANGRLGAWDPVLDVADQLRYSIYGVDVPGMSNDASVLTTRYGSELGPAPMSFLFTEPAGDATLRYLAEYTGGETLIDGDRRQLFERVKREARSYYSLAFSAERDRDDESHEIRVEVRQPELEVRSRRMFRDLSASTELDYALEAALLDATIRTPESALVASLGVPRRERAGRVVVPLRLQVPSSPVRPAPSDAPRSLELRVAAVDDEGRRVIVGPVAVSADAAGAIELPLRLRRAAQDLAVSLHDPASGESHLANLRLEP